MLGLSLIHAADDHVPIACAISTAVGILAHVLYFIHGNRNLVALRIFLIHLSVLAGLLVRAINVLGAQRGALSAGLLYGCYLAGLFGSMVVYRIFFHPLRRFPGEFWPKVSQIYNAWFNAGGVVHDRLERGHEVHGDFLRTGPNTLSILSIDALSKIHGATTGCTKANAGNYDFSTFRGVSDLEFITDKAAHRLRRRVWDRATNKKQTRTYEDKARPVILQWIATLRHTSGTPVDISGLASLFAFDHIGAVGYSKEFGGLRTGELCRLWRAVKALFDAMGVAGALTWPVAALAGVPSLGVKREFEDAAVELVDEREKLDLPVGSDILSHFIADHRSEKPIAFDNHDKIIADILILSIGGTETLDTALSCSFYRLALQPTYITQLREAITPAFGASEPGVFRTADLEAIPLVDAVINEVMRVQCPAVISGPRLTPPEGIHVDGVWIPGGCKKYFKQAKEFIPERWTTRPELILDKRAFHPFNIGRHECPGKYIAMAALRLSLAYMVWNFDWDFASGDDGSSIWRKERWLFSRRAGPLQCVFRCWWEDAEGSAAEG